MRTAVKQLGSTLLLSSRRKARSSPPTKTDRDQKRVGKDSLHLRDWPGSQNGIACWVLVFPLAVLEELMILLPGSLQAISHVIGGLK